MTDTASSSPGTASDVDVTRAAYQEAVDAWQEVQRRRYYPQWQLMANVVAPAQAYITALETQNAALLATVDSQAAALEAIRQQVEERWRAHEAEVRRVLAWNDVSPDVVYDAFHNASIILGGVIRRQAQEAASADADTPTGGES